MNTRILSATTVGLLAIAWYSAHAASRGGEPCTQNSDCETNACVDGKCDPCPDADHCPPPGKCSDSEHSSLKYEVGKACKSDPFTCKSWNTDENEADGSELLLRLQRGENCLKAREEIMQRCFKGGDSTHQSSRNDVRTARDFCRDVIDYKKGKSVAYTCSSSDYESYGRDVQRACSQDLVCEGSKDDAKVDCARLEERGRNNRACLDAADYIVSRCFNGNRSDRRRDKRTKTEEKQRNCADLLDYKKSHDACQ
jgi:hypothetical protein